MNKEIIYTGKKICYRVIGKGKPVVLIHGFGEDGKIWKPPKTPPKEGLSNPQNLSIEHPLLPEGFQFIIPDLPGSGNSEMIDDMSIEGMAEVIKNIIDLEINNEPTSNDSVISEAGAWMAFPFGGSRKGAGVALIGHSMGGYITLAFAEKYPEYLNAFGLFHSTAYADSEEKKNSRLKGIDFIKQHGAFEFLKTVVPNLFSPESKKIMPDKIKTFVKSLYNFSPAALVSYYEAMMQRPDRRNVLVMSKVPVLFLFGEFDMAVPLKDGLELCHLPEKSYIHILQKSGHMGMLEETEECNRILSKFLIETL